ncbi:helix-turn-helix transcriptional regulator [Lactobacillus agilis]|uniref:Helix-turn-helix transcriptional regulator n=1 Tax=Ligilactobacillus agilis TaxID=1601 RepID=A0A848CCS0_9LACO|nr:helix-turn-helix transcriptional regulator [Ligilactobacillus agilis]NME42196.1 helix-turn-helix transcriptional regulator [Ligilactobacillus agilis]
MARTKSSPQDAVYKKIISNNLSELLAASGKKKIDITRQYEIPATTLSGYFSGTRLPSNENVKKLAKFFNVSESDIDPRFKPVTNDEENKSHKIEDILDSAMTFNGKPLTENDRNVIRGMIEAYLDNKE